MKIKTASDQKCMKKTSQNDKSWSDFLRYLKEYGQSTGIHGIRYLTETRSVLEKLFWVIILLMSLGGCSFMVYQIIEKYQTSPIILVSATRDTPLFEIPFPAVTICPDTQCSEKKFNFSQVYSQFRSSNSPVKNYTELRYLYYITMLCNLEEENIFFANYNISVEDDFFEISYKFNPSEIVECSYMGEECSEYFTPIVTDQGICYSFNIIDKKDMFRDHVYYNNYFQNVTTQPFAYRSDRGYLDKTEINTYPRRALLSGADNSLKLNFVHVRYATDLHCNKFEQGYRVLLHNPLEFPRLHKSYFHVPLDEAVVVVPQPHVKTTSEGVKSFNPERRNCYLENERYLYYFKVYTQSNCLLECETNYTLQHCGCVHYHMPRENGTKICNTIRDFTCLYKASRTLKVQELKNKITGLKKTLDCNCKLSCTSLTYTFEISNSKNYIKEYFTFVLNTTTILDLYNHHYSVLSIYFNTDQFIAIERNELYGTSDLVSNFGGLLGLFTGFSLISGVEIIYFFTLRIFYNISLYGRWFGSSSHA